MSSIQSLLSYHGKDYISNHSVFFQQFKAMYAISGCRTPQMGSHVLACDCGHTQVVSNSCSNRHCPTCSTFKKEVWVAKQEASLLPSHYFHLVFTVPEPLRLLIYYNQKVLYNLLYASVSKTLLALSKDKLGVVHGFSLMLHTWSQTLMFHPHLHCILAGGGLSFDQLHFKSFEKKFFIHVKILSAVFRGKFLDELKTLYHEGGLFLPENLSSSNDDPNVFQSLVDSLYSTDWVVFLSLFLSAPITYLTIWDVTLIVLPHRFVKIRHYGFLSNR